MAARFVVKVQFPIVTSAPQQRALVYDRYRTVEQEFPITKAFRRAMGGSVKAYFWAHMEGTELHLDERAGNQSW